MFSSEPWPQEFAGFENMGFSRPELMKKLLPDIATQLCYPVATGPSDLFFFAGFLQGKSFGLASPGICSQTHGGRSRCAVRLFAVGHWHIRDTITATHYVVMKDRCPPLTSGNVVLIGFTIDTQLSEHASGRITHLLGLEVNFLVTETT
jgi:hypothetical protein